MLLLQGVSRRWFGQEFKILLTGATRKQEMIDRLMCMMHIGALQQDETTDSEVTCAISYLPDVTKRVLRDLPSFTSIDSWNKELCGKLKEFTFMNLLILVYGRDETFDMQSLKAFRSFKAYKYFFDGFVRNIWVHECSSNNDLSLRVLYFRAYVHHSLTCDSPLDVYVAVNGDNGDVYSGRCTYVSG